MKVRAVAIGLLGAAAIGAAIHASPARARADNVRDERVASGRASFSRARLARVSGHGHSSGPRLVVPILAGELVPPMMSYRAYVKSLLTSLQTQVATLVTTVDAGDLAGAESAWLTAHLTWLRIGQDDGAYGAFGELGRQIDGTAAGLVLGTASPDFTGFHKVELDLWTNHDLTAAGADAAKLQALVGALVKRRLAKELPTSVIGLIDWTLRCHEILEDGLRDSLSGNDDYGSGTDLASLTADVAATREVLGLLAPLVAPSSPHLVGRALRELAGLIDAVDATRQDGQWVAASALPLSERERVNAATGAVLETLAPVPDLLQIGNAP